MTEENKPLETDSNEEEIDQLFEEETQEGNDTPVEGEKDVSEPVDENKVFLEKFKEITGREFKDVDDAKKHYKNLSSYVGKPKKEKPDKEVIEQEVKEDGLSEIKNSIQRMEFLNENPDAKKHFETTIKPLAQGKGISLDEAWKELKPLFEQQEKSENESELGINVNNAPIPNKDPEIAKLKKLAAQGDLRAQQELIGKLMPE